jgi:hypothetical protein
MLWIVFQILLSHVKEGFDRIKSKGIEVLNKLFELPVDLKDYQTLYKYFK